MADGSKHLERVKVPGNQLVFPPFGRVSAQDFCYVNGHRPVLHYPSQLVNCDPLVRGLLSLGVALTLNFILYEFRPAAFLTAKWC